MNPRITNNQIPGIAPNPEMAPEGVKMPETLAENSDAIVGAEQVATPGTVLPQMPVEAAPIEVPTDTSRVDQEGLVVDGIVETPLTDPKELDKEYVERAEEAREELKHKPAELKEKFDEIGQHYLDEKFGKELSKTEAE